MPTDTFGLPTVAPEQDPLFADAPAEAPVASESEQAQETQQQQQQSESTTPEEGLLGGKYKSVRDLELAYSELRDLQRRTAERANEYERYAAAVEAELNQLRSYVQSLSATLQAQRAAQAAQAAPTEFGSEWDLGELPQQPQLDPAALQAMIDQRLQQHSQAQLQLMLAQQQAQEEAQEQLQETAEAIFEFYRRHPEVEPRGDIDAQITETIKDLNTAWEDHDVEVEISNVEALEAVYEASRRPALKRVLSMHPEYFESEEGMQLARNLAATLEVAPQPGNTRAEQVGANTQRAFVERASSPGPVGEGPKDEFEQAVLEYRDQRSRNKGSVFFS
jgi:hypothetical protein